MAHYKFLRNQAISPLKSYLEVGVQEGGSLAAVLEQHRNLERVVLIDTWDSRHGGTNRGSGDHIVRLIRKLGIDPEAIGLDIRSGRSQEILPTLPAGSDKTDRFGLVHIDGSHDYEDAVSDLRYGWRLVAPGGYMVVHDLSFPNVHLAVVEFVEANRSLIVTAGLDIDDEWSISFRKVIPKA